MYRRQFLLAIAFTTSLTTTVVIGCSNQAPIGKSGKQVLTMVTSPDYRPYEFYDTASGSDQVVGFDIDIAKHITQELGYELKVLETDFNGVIPALRSQRADFAMAGLTPTEERKQSIDFSVLYYENKDTIVSLKGHKLRQITDLVGKKVGVQLGSIQEGKAKEIAQTNQGLTILPLNKIGEIIEELKSQRIDAAIIEDSIAKGYAANNPNLEFHTIASQAVSGSAIAFPKGSKLVRDFDRVLQKMKDSGELDRLVKKWFEGS